MAFILEGCGCGCGGNEDEFYVGLDPDLHSSISLNIEPLYLLWSQGDDYDLTRIT